MTTEIGNVGEAPNGKNKRKLLYGDMVELVDTLDSKSSAEERNGSSPFIPTNGAVA